MPFGGPKYPPFAYSSISEVSRTRCTRLHAEGDVVLAGLKRICRGCLPKGSKRPFFRVFLRFPSAGRYEGQSINSVRPADTCTRCTRLRRDSAEQNCMDLKNRPKMPSECSEDALLCPFLAFPHNAGTTDFFRHRRCASVNVKVHSIIPFRNSTPTNRPRKAWFKAPCVFLEVVKCCVV